MRALVISTDAPSVHGPPQGHWSYADWELLPDDGNTYEIINGVLYMTTAPRTFHQWIQQRLYRFIGIPVEDRQFGYVFTAPVGLLMPGCDPVQPDFVFVRQANAGILADGRIRGVPDLIVEILSPGSVIYDAQVKLVAYAMAAVPEYAIVNPRTRTLERYWLHSPGRYNGPQTFGESDDMRFDCLPEVTLRIADLFAGAPDPSL
jgi:Uma2 family endonuclease